MIFGIGILILVMWQILDLVTIFLKKIDLPNGHCHFHK